MRDFYKFFFLCEQTCERQPTAGMETLQTGYFELSALPKLSTGRCIVEDVELAFEFQGDPTLSSVVD